MSVPKGSPYIFTQFLVSYLDCPIFALSARSYYYIIEQCILNIGDTAKGQLYTDVLHPVVSHVVGDVLYIEDVARAKKNVSFFWNENGNIHSFEMQPSVVQKSQYLEIKPFTWWHASNVKAHLLKLCHYGLLICEIVALHYLSLLLQQLPTSIFQEYHPIKKFQVINCERLDRITNLCIS